jgi:hypothetical protein
MQVQTLVTSAGTRSFRMGVQMLGCSRSGSPRNGANRDRARQTLTMGPRLAVHDVNPEAGSDLRAGSALSRVVGDVPCPGQT